MKFVEDADKWQLLDRTVSQVRNAFADMSADELNYTIDEAVEAVRKEKRNKSKRGRRK